ncbi:Aste57867_11332 [Aphanomyces stellatus]|uniref:DNA repair protein RAD51 homolog 3 n=1 Tax=Aphanomyces stellatus TaxID=120398 RepID=A0A485KT52_9STRA|nr:hypothetical protein As57867_011290 [Aphanomyces stellatus]VFT88194.1 Aste57867_11332 [Aphanomyces stellatus]
MAGIHQDLGLLSIAPTVLASLYQAGFHTSKDVQGIHARELSNVVKISLQDAASVLNALKGVHRMSIGVSALDVYRQTQTQKPIQTFIPDIDSILGGGIPIGEITEICGVPGIGKTQMSIHLALCAQYGDSKRLSESIYIGMSPKLTCRRSTNVPVSLDTEGSFLVSRAKAMAESMADEFRDAAPHDVVVTKEVLLRGITYYRVYDYQEQHDVLLALARQLASRSHVRLVVVDSVAFHCRHAFDDNSGRARALHNLTVALRKLLQDFPIAIVLINHVTTSVMEGTDSSIVPALGEAWSHAITTRLVLSWEDQVRTAQIAKSPSEPPRACHFEGTRHPISCHLTHFVVTERGVRPFSRKRSRSDDASPLC